MAITSDVSSYLNRISGYGSGYSSTGSSGSFGVRAASTSSSSSSGSSKPLTEIAQDYVNQVKNNGESLASALLKTLPTSKDSVLNKYTPESSNTDILTVKAKAGSASTTVPKTFGVQVDQIATTQKNVGTALESTGLSLEANTYNQIQIEVNGKKSLFSVSTTENDTNKSVQQKLADRINKADIGIKATVVYDSETKTSSLNLESKNTGTYNSNQDVFTVTDTTGNAASVFGLNNVDQKAQNALYSINGGEQKSSRSNTVDVNNQVSMTLLKSSEGGEVSVSAAKDLLSQQNAARELVNAFNGLMEAANDNNSDKGAKRLANELAGAAITYGNSLSKIGVSINDDGYLKIDESKKKSAAESGALEKFFTENANSNYGFTGRMNNIAKNISSSDTAYLSNSENNYAASSSSSSSDFYSKMQSDYGNYANTLGLSSKFNSYMQTSALLTSMFNTTL